MKKVNGTSLAVGLFLGFMTIMGSAIAVPLSKGNCENPKPYTDLRHCRFEKSDLRNKDLQGVDLRNVGLNGTQFQGANLTNALFDGVYITHANLDGVIGLPTEALAILKNSYLAKPNGNAGFVISALPRNYQGSNENVAGLDNLFMAQRVIGTQTTIALLAHPKYGEAPISAIFARFENDKFDFPTCYQSVNLLRDSHTYYWPRWESMKIRLTNDGDYLIGVLAQGNDGDDLGLNEWRQISILMMTPTCKLTVLHKEFLERSGGSIEMNGEYIAEWCGGELGYRFIDDQTVEIKTTYPASTKKVCGDLARANAQVSHKRIKLNSSR
ncbi:pentapeptide repeat protein [mine drainage metagenome]|uniref:Pentapeptide repeat protein n=1 Tax=mine drainage metagenome TaxID=410659 RepID=A0A1J5SZJ0_9ZZZZ